MPHERLKLSMTQHYPPEGSHQWINAFKNALYTDLEEIRNPLKFQSMWKKFQLNDNQMICSILVNTQPNYVRVWRNQLLQLLLLPDFAWHQQRPSWCIARCTGALAAACSLAWGTEAEMLTFEKHSSCFVYKMASAGISNIPVFFSIFLSMKENVLFFLKKINANICWGHNVFRWWIYLFTLLWKSCVTDFFYQHCQTYLFVLNRELNVYH